MFEGISGSEMRPIYDKGPRKQLAKLWAKLERRRRFRTGGFVENLLYSTKHLASSKTGVFRTRRLCLVSGMELIFGWLLAAVPLMIFLYLALPSLGEAKLVSGCFWRALPRSECSGAMVSDGAALCRALFV